MDTAERRGQAHTTKDRSLHKVSVPRCVSKLDERTANVLFAMNRINFRVQWIGQMRAPGRLEQHNRVKVVRDEVIIAKGRVERKFDSC